MAEVKSFFDKDTSTLTHIVYDPTTRDAVVIDPVMDFNLQTFKWAQHSVEQIVHFCQDLKLHIHSILETHAHADHLSGSQLLKDFYPKAKICIGKEITSVQKHFSEFFELENFPCDGSQFDLLFENAKQLNAGSLSIKTWHTPGHTPACYTLQIEDKLFTGDALFAPDIGTGRCDFPGGSAKDLFNSIKNTIYKQNDHSEVYFGHDYPDGKREVMEHVSLASEKKTNARLKVSTKEEDFVKARTHRDEELAPPKLFLPSLLVNIAGGRLPPKRKSGKVFFSFPLNSL